MVANGKIHQVISWSRPDKHTSELSYIIKYELTSQENGSQSSAKTITSNGESVNLTLPTVPSYTPRRPIMYYVSVAAVSDAGQGQFSDKTVLAYKSKNQCLST